MKTQEKTDAITKYRCVLVCPHSRSVLVISESDGYRLPRVQIAVTARTTRVIQEEIKVIYGVSVFLLAIWTAPDGATACAVAERLTLTLPRFLREVALEQLAITELDEGERRRLEVLFENRAISPFSHIGWIDEGLSWIRSATGSSFSSKSHIEQWNAGGGFALLRVCSDDGLNYWLKGTGEPNLHELAITSLLGELSPEFVPKVISVRKEWNAWLTKGEGIPLPASPGPSELQSVATSLARLQLLTIGQTEKLLAAGAFDLRLPELRSQITGVTDYLIEAMERQASRRAAPLSRYRLRELAEILRDASLHLEALDIPDTLIHNDLNVDNILCDGSKYVFTDWSEAAVGNPILSCERLCQLNRQCASSTRDAYRTCWLDRLTAEAIDKAITLAPLLAIYACLLGRGGWLRLTECVRPELESYRRSLARHMDQAAKDPSLLEILCR